MTAWIALLLILVAAAVVVLQGDAGSLGGFEPAELASLAAALALIVFYLPRLLSGYGGRAATGLRDALIWVALGLVLVVAYTFRNEAQTVWQRLAGELLPAGTTLTVTDDGSGERSVRLRKRNDGHFVARAEIEGVAITMIVDTGASTIVLRPADAERIGIDLASLVYEVPVSTANGTAYAARVRLKSVFVGPLGLNGLEALVARPGALGESLLGMNFLSRLRSYDFAGDYLTLRG